MKFPNLGLSCCMPRPKMMSNSWTLRGILQYSLARGLLKKNDDDNGMKKKKSPKVMNTL